MSKEHPSVESSDFVNFEQDTVKTISYIESQASDILQMEKGKIIRSLGLHTLVRTIVIATIILVILVTLIILYCHFNIARATVKATFTIVTIPFSFLSSCCQKKPKPSAPESSTPRIILRAFRRNPLIKDTVSTATVESGNLYPSLEEVRVISQAPKVPPKTVAKPLNLEIPKFKPRVSSVQLDSMSTIFIPVTLNHLSTVALFDTGSAITLLSERMATLSNLIITETTLPEGITANGSPIHFIGQVSTKLTVADKVVSIISFVVSDENCSTDFLLGNDSINKLGNKVSIDYSEKTVSFDNTTVQIIIPDKPDLTSYKTPVFLAENVTLPPMSDNVVIGTLHRTFPSKWEFLVCDDLSLTLPFGIAIENVEQSQSVERTSRSQLRNQPFRVDPNLDLEEEDE
ncbi:unnamed protein product [Cylicocyclus nassatus]|uniref:Peptidase A2 domain-containing protein n=1 Tax=Cylicocyclus nassatus TaxID=53992 RepID=A0AA36MC31_CYLNA|nr:unnamed protein product [Cylicocyclus nassatus]